MYKNLIKNPAQFQVEQVGGKILYEKTIEFSCKSFVIHLLDPDFGKYKILASLRFNSYKKIALIVELKNWIASK